MTVPEFAEAVVLYAKTYGGSVTRWGSTTIHTIRVGGFAGDPHTWFLGADLVYDGTPNRPGAKLSGHALTPHSCPSCSQFGLKVIHEKTHDHLQPLDFPAGPVTQYPLEARDA